jgi:uncharacterized protein
MQTAVRQEGKHGLRDIGRALCFAIGVLFALGCNKSETPRGYGWLLEREGQGRVLLIPALHVSKNSMRALPRFVEASILASEALAVEYVSDDSDDLNRQRLSHCLRGTRSASNESEALEPTTRDAVGQLLRKNGLASSEQLHTALDAQRMVGKAMLKALGLRTELGIDAALRAAASNFSKPIESLDPSCATIVLMAAVERSATNASVIEYVNGVVSGEFEEVWRDLERSWVLGDQPLGCAAFGRLLSSSALDRQAFEVAIRGRNAGLADGINRVSSGGRAIVAAVGLGHFCGTNTLLAELSRLGYRATPLRG